MEALVLPRGKVSPHTGLCGALFLRYDSAMQTTEQIDQPVQMEQRTCANPECANRFRVWVSSTRKHCCTPCELKDTGQAGNIGWKAQHERNKKFSKPIPEGQITVVELAARLDVQPGSVYQWIARCGLKGHKTGKYVRFIWEEAIQHNSVAKALKRKLERQQAGAAPKHPEIKPVAPIIHKEPTPVVEKEPEQLYATTTRAPEVAEPAIQSIQNVQIPKEEQLFLIARASCKELVEEAKRCREDKLHEAELVLLRMAIKRLGLG